MLRPVALGFIALAIMGVPASASAQDEAPTAPDENFNTLVAMAMTGEPEALSILGRTFEAGWWGLTPDYAVAARWHRLAAEQGHAHSQRQLAASYGLGRGLLQDYVQAYKWMALAAARLSGEEFDSASKGRALLADWLPSGQLATARQLAQDWRPLTFDEAKAVLVSWPPLDAGCGDAWTEMVGMLFDVECLPD